MQNAHLAGNGPFYTSFIVWDIGQVTGRGVKYLNFSRAAACRPLFMGRVGCNFRIVTMSS
jgi:hypothetical protein